MVRGMRIREEELYERKNNVNNPVPAEKQEKEEETEKLSLEECLFCTYTSPTLTLNISHMHKAHGLFIPEQKYLIDLSGLIRYLGEKVAILHQCLYCGRVKGGLEGVRTHMRDVGHCRIAFDTIEEQVEVGEFYDFRSTYDGVEGSDSEDKEEPPARYHRRRSSSGIKSNRRASEGFKTETGVHEGDEDEAWETDSSASSLDSTDLCAVPLDYHHSGCSSTDGQDHHHHHHRHYKPHHHHHHHHHHLHPHISPVYHTEYELHLPSGRMAGHRSLARYYRQNLSHPLTERLTRQRPRRLLQDITAEYGDGEEEEIVDGFSEDNITTTTSRFAPSRELTRRERRDLFFGRMAEEERAIVLGAEGARRAERGLSGTARGELGMVGVSADKRRFVREDERRARRGEQRKILRITAKVQKQQNSQKHFRDPLLQ